MGVRLFASHRARMVVIVCAMAVGELLPAAHGDERKPDIEAGKAASLPCQSCHGSNGVNTSPDIPNLAGQKESYLAAQLRAFKSGERKNDFMSAIASQLGKAEIDNLAAYWNSLPASADAAVSVVLESSKSPMTFPADFPKGFILYHSSKEQDGSTADLYANDVAANAARTGKPLPVGALIITVNHSADRKSHSYSAMESRSGWGDAVPELLRNGDWRYALFDGAKQRRDGFNYAKCLACHKPMAQQSFVFTLDTLAKSKSTAP
jgi:cytochrome c553